MVDHELMQVLNMVYEWRLKNRVEDVSFSSAEESEFSFHVRTVDREGNIYTANGVRHDRDDG